MPFVIDKFKSKNGASVVEEFALFNEVHSCIFGRAMLSYDLIKNQSQVNDKGPEDPLVFC